MAGREQTPQSVDSWPELGIGHAPTAEELSEHMEEVLTSGRLEGGDRLPSERKLAEAYGVSRPLVREVLQILQERGLIRVMPGRGSFVRDTKFTENGTSIDLVARRGKITPSELIVARSMLESEAAALAAKNASETDIEQMELIVEALTRAETTRAEADLDIAFHEAVAVASANPVVQIMFGSIRNLTRAIVLRSLTDPEIREEGVQGHRQILECIKAGDSTGARRAMTAHLDLARRLYGPDLDQPLVDVLAARALATPSAADLLQSAGEHLEA